MMLVEITVRGKHVEIPEAVDERYRVMRRVHEQAVEFIDLEIIVKEESESPSDEAG